MSRGIIAVVRRDNLPVVEILGVEVVCAEEPGDLPRILEEVSKDRGVFLVLVDEELWDDESISRFKLVNPLPLVVPLSLPEDYVAVLKGILGEPSTF